MKSIIAAAVNNYCNTKNNYQTCCGTTLARENPGNYMQYTPYSAVTIGKYSYLHQFDKVFGIGNLHTSTLMGTSLVHGEGDLDLVKIGFLINYAKAWLTSSRFER